MRSSPAPSLSGYDPPLPVIPLEAITIATVRPSTGIASRSRVADLLAKTSTDAAINLGDLLYMLYLQTLMADIEYDSSHDKIYDHSRHIIQNERNWRASLQDQLHERPRTFHFVVECKTLYVNSSGALRCAIILISLLL